MDIKKHISLAELADGQTAVIVNVLGGKNLIKRLADLGMSSGTRITVLRKSLFSGPVQVEVSGSRLVLGGGMASKIYVEMK
jgi:ferrous iron transport protein A